MRACALLIICALFAACKPKEQPTPTPVITPVKYLAEYQEMSLWKTMDITGADDTAFRYFGGAVFNTEKKGGGGYNVGEVKYNDIALLGNSLYFWPDSALSIPATGIWHIGGNATYDAIDYTDNLQWPVLNNLPDTIHLGSPLSLSFENTHFVYAHIFKTKVFEQPLNDAHSYAGALTFTFDYIPDYGDSAYIRINAYNMSDSADIPVFYKNCTWGKWVKTVYP